MGKENTIIYNNLKNTLYTDWKLYTTKIEGYIKTLAEILINTKIYGYSEMYF